MHVIADSVTTVTPLDAVRLRLHALLRTLARRQAAALAARAALSGVAAALGAVALLLAADLVFVLGPAARDALRWAPFAALAGTAAVSLRRTHAALRPMSLARIVEARHPGLDHMLPTVLDAGGGGRLDDVLARRADTALDAIATGGLVVWRIERPAWLGIGALVAATTLLAFSPGGPAEAVGRWLHPSSAAAWSARGPAGIGGSAPADASAPRFERLEIRVTPPAYTGLTPFDVGADDVIAVLPGSTVRVSGRVPDRADTVTGALVGGGNLHVTTDGRGWQVQWTAAPAHRALVMEAGVGAGAIARRVLPLLALPDHPPAVVLLDPDSDLVLATGRGVVTVSARATDDFGVTSFDLAWVRSRGSGESFQYEEFTAPWTAAGGDARSRTGSASLDIAALGLQPGDALHVRAIARDGAGAASASTTRVIRIAREDEEDLVNTVIGFPLEGEASPVLSQRMIIVLTERLLARAGTLSDDAFREDAEGVAHEQARLRRQVGDQMYVRATGGVQDPDDDFGAEDRHEQATIGQPHLHDESMIVAVNRPLMEIYDAMWSAERELRLIRPGDALPHERHALDLLQALRQAERVYSRAPQRAPPVDVSAARGTGKLVDADPAARSPRPPLTTDAALADRTDEAARRVGGLAAAQAALVLSGLAADVLASDATAAAAAGALLARAADRAARGERGRAAELARAAHRALSPDAGIVAAQVIAADGSPAAGEYRRRRTAASAGTDRTAARGAAGAPFAFATLRYQSGNWDSAPLVPTNVAHAIAQYTDIAVASEGTVVDLGADELFRHPFVFMTGHLPVRFTDEEARNLRAYVERGGFVFIDDHGHDIDGAFHRTVTAELARVFGTDALRRLPNDHELYRTFFVFEDGPPTTPHEMNGWGDGLVHEHLSAVTVGDRIGVLYSNKDYSSEWNYHHPNKRFLGLDNTRFAVNIIVYALTR